jgi:transcriptional regulator GlxA family with amidase domain
MFRSDLSENLSLGDVARACKLSVSHFARAFKASTGIPPHQWVMTARIDMARGMLANSPTPLVEVAGVCGFADQSHFSRVFARMTGTSPGAWRREYRV